MRYITMHEALFIHSTLLKAHGGADGIRDRGLIEAALLRPQTGYYADLIEEAAAMWESLALGYGFYDGNWQVAFAVTEVFLSLNGIELTAEPSDTEYFISFNLKSGTFNKDIAEIWLNTNVEEAADGIIDATEHHRQSRPS